jgi:hypothetical protein
VVSAVAPTRADAGNGGQRQTVLVKLGLADDAALAGVVASLGELGSHIVALKKTEPSLEDVFVELVGRGFEDAEAGHDDDGAGPSSPPPGHRPPAEAPESREEELVR